MHHRQRSHTVPISPATARSMCTLLTVACVHDCVVVRRCIAKIAETFVFVYLGMACVRMAKIGMFNGTVWRLSTFGIIGCFLGRLHIFVGSWVTDRPGSTARARLCLTCPQRVGVCDCVCVCVCVCMSTAHQSLPHAIV